MIALKHGILTTISSDPVFSGMLQIRLLDIFIINFCFFVDTGASFLQVIKCS